MRRAKTQQAHVLSRREQQAVRILSKVRRAAAWMMLPTLLFPFVEGLFFVFWGWAFLGLYLTFESLVDIIKREAQFMGCEDVEFHGRSAVLASSVLLVVALSIFVLPGIALMLEEPFPI